MSYEVPVLRSIVAVGGGFFATAVLSLAADILFSRLVPEWFDGKGRPQVDRAFEIIIAYGALFYFAGGYIAARIASHRHVMHALAAGSLTLVISAIVAAFMWDSVPRWYTIASLVLVLPLAFIGGKVRVALLERTSSSPS